MKNIDIVRSSAKHCKLPRVLSPTSQTARVMICAMPLIPPLFTMSWVGCLETMFKDGIKKTIQWYLDNKSWWENIISGEYQNYFQKMYGKRLADAEEKA